MIGHLLTRTADVYRPSTATDAVGGQTVTLEAAGTVRVKAGQPTTEERRTAGAWAAELTHVVHSARGTDIRRGDQLDLGGTLRLRVLATIEDSHRTYLRADCEAFQPEGG